MIFACRSAEEASQTSLGATAWLNTVCFKPQAVTFQNGSQARKSREQRKQHTHTHTHTQEAAASSRQAGGGSVCVLKCVSVREKDEEA